MPIFNVKPKIKLTDEQERELFIREAKKKTSDQGFGLSQVADMIPGQQQQPMMPPSGMDAIGMMEASPAPLGPITPEYRGIDSSKLKGPLPPIDIANKARRMNSADVVIPATAELSSRALVAAKLWKDLGGYRSVGGKLWSILMEKADTVHDDPREYFISSYLRWNIDPEKFAREHPTETNLISKMQSTFEESYRPKSVSETLPPVPGREENVISSGME